MKVSPVAKQSRKKERDKGHDIYSKVNFTLPFPAMILLLVTSPSSGQICLSLHENLEKTVRSVKQFVAILVIFKAQFWQFFQ